MISNPSRSRRFEEPTFPRGRYVIKIGRDLILNPKEADQVYKYSRFPYIVGIHHRLPHIWQGLNGTEMSQSPQTYVNTTFSTLLNYVKFHGNPPTVVEEDALADSQKGKVNKKPGAQIEMKANKI